MMTNKIELTTNDVAWRYGYAGLHCFPNGDKPLLGFFQIGTKDYTLTVGQSDANLDDDNLKDKASIQLDEIDDDHNSYVAYFSEQLPPQQAIDLAHRIVDYINDTCYGTDKCLDSNDLCTRFNLTKELI